MSRAGRVKSQVVPAGQVSSGACPRRVKVGAVGPWWRVLKTDNDGVFKQSTKAINHTVAKHYRIAQAYIREMVLNGTIDVQQDNSDTNEADMLTKALTALLFVPHVISTMGPQRRL